MEDLKYLIRIDCITFNQASYIEAAMNGFCMQDTNFPFVCTIIDDASTDGEPEVIRRYLAEHFAINDEKTARKEETDDYVMQFAQHKTNKNCFVAVLFLKYNHYSIKKSKLPYLKDWEDTKYVAICEGDDYWIDPLKLQKQFDFMESHPECSMCFHSHQDIYPDGRVVSIAPKENEEFFYPKQIIAIGNNIIGTNTIFYRNCYLQEEGRPEFWKTCPVGDIPMRLYFVSKGPVGYINEQMSVYRRNSQGGWTSKRRSLRERTNHHRKIIKTYRLYDDYTNRKYHPIVCSKISKLKYTILKDTVKSVFHFS